MPETFSVMVEEGQAYGASIEEQMFPGRGGARWAAMVTTIYDAPKLEQVFSEALQAALRDDPATVAAAQAFFGSTSATASLALRSRPAARFWTRRPRKPPGSRPNACRPSVTPAWA